MCVCRDRRTLADIIMEKITEKQTEVGTVMSEVSGRAVPQLDPRVVEVYRGVSKVRQTSGHFHLEKIVFFPQMLVNVKLTNFFPAYNQINTKA